MRTSRLNRIQSQRNSSAKKYIFIGLGIFAIFIIGFALYKAFSFFSNIQTGKPTEVVKPTKKPEEKNTYNILLLGYGGGNHDGTYLTDTIIVLHIDLKQKKTILVSIPRDIWINLPTKSGDEFNSKINAAYQLGLFPKNYPDLDTNITKTDKTGFIKHAAKQITGLDIDGYLAIDFEGFTKAIDILGGIEVNVERSFTDYEYPIEGKETDTCEKKDQELEDALKVATEDARLAFPCRYEDLRFTKGPTKMDGKTALKFARSRHALEDGGDFNRAARQHKVIEAVKDKVLTVTFIPKIFPLMDELDDHIRTDIQRNEISKLLLEAPKLNEYKRTTLALSDSNFLKNAFSEYGGYILIPEAGEDNWSDVQKEIKNIRLGITPTPTPTVTPTVAPTSKVKKLTPTPTKSVKKVTPKLSPTKAK